MKNWKLLIAVSCGFILFACVQALYIPFEAYQIAKGVGAGIPALPYYAQSKTALKDMEGAIAESGASVTLADTYRAAYGKKFNDVPDDGNTGQAFSDMKTASVYLQAILKDQGAGDYNNFFLTSADFGNSPGFSLVAAVYRDKHAIRIKDKRNPRSVMQAAPSQPSFFVPYRTDSDEKPLDIVYEWAALPNDCFSRQGHQAIMLTLAANKILQKQPRPDYWDAEKAWQAGDYQAVVLKQDQAVCMALNIKKGYAQMPGAFERKN